MTSDRPDSLDPASPDSVDRGLAEAFREVEPAIQSSVLRALQARAGSQLGVDLDGENGRDDSVGAASTAQELRDPSGRYQVLGEIGRGGVGVVYKGRDSDLGRDVAMKVLKDEYADRPEVLARFVEEAQIGGQLQHPGIVPVYELGLHAGERPYFAMKLVKGETLAAQLARRSGAAEDRRRFLGMFEQMCQTVAYAHIRRVMHRDLKPANVMIGAFGEVQIVDWGFAKVLPKGGVADEKESVQRASERSVIETVRSTPGSGSHSRAGSVMGTPAYMSPEQAAGDIDHLDCRSDVFGLGAILCEILTGEPPYREADGDLVRQAANAELDGAYERLDRCGADESLITLCKECLARARRARPESSTEVAERVGAYLTSVEDRARHAELRAAEARFKHRTTLLASAAALVILTLGGGTWLWLDGQAQERRTEVMQRVAAARSAASGAHGQAMATSLDLSLWTTAVTSAEQLAALADSEHVKPGIREDVGEQLARIRGGHRAAAAEVERRERDEAMLASLQNLRIPVDDDVRTHGWHERESHRLDDEYAAAFEEYLDGASLFGSSVEESLAALKGVISVELATSLDHWSLVRDGHRCEVHSIDPSETVRLRELARRLDPDDQWRDRLRSLLPEVESAGERLIALADEVDMTALTAAGCRVLQLALWRAGEEDVSVAVLRRARELHPQDFDLCFSLGLHLERLEVPLWEEAVGTYRIAYALQPDHDEVLHRWGLALMEVGRHADAERITRRLHLRHPDDPHFLRHHAKTIIDQGRFDEGVELYERCCDLDPTDGQTYKSVGLAYAEQGNDERAIELYRQAVQLQPWNAEAHTNLGNALSRQGQHEEAVEYCRKAVEKDDQNAVFHNNLGSALKNQGLLEEATTSLLLAIDLGPRYPVHHRNLGDVLLKQGKYEEASERYLAALEIDPNNDPALNGLGNVRKEQGELEEAIALHLRAIDIDPLNPLYHCNLGLDYYVQGRLEEAVQKHRDALALDSEAFYPYPGLGGALMELGNYAEAERAFRKALEVEHPNCLSCQTNLGIALDAQGRAEDAIQHLLLALGIDENHVPALVWMGKVLSGLERCEEAVNYLERAREIDPEDATVHEALGVALGTMGQTEDAIESLRRAIGLDPSSAIMHCNLGFMLMEAGRLEEAVESLKRSLGFDPSIPGTYLNLGVTLRRLGRTEEALPVLERALELVAGQTSAHRRQIESKAHHELGFVLSNLGRVDEAISCFRESLKFDPLNARTHINLGNQLQKRGDVDAAKEAYEQAAELFTQQVGPFARQWESFAREQLEKLDHVPELLEVLTGKRRAESGEEWAAAVDVGYDQRKLAEIVRLTEQTLRNAPDVVEGDPENPNWGFYNSACAAALLAGDPSADVTDEERSRVRDLAWEWLWSEVELWESWEDSDLAAEGRKRLQNALQDADFAGVRGDALADLAEVEREAWEELWSHIDAAIQGER